MLSPEDFENLYSNQTTMVLRVKIDYDWVNGADFHDVTMVLINPSQNEWNVVGDRQREIAQRNSKPGN